MSENSSQEEHLSINDTNSVVVETVDNSVVENLSESEMAIQDEAEISLDINKSEEKVEENEIKDRSTDSVIEPSTEIINESKSNERILQILNMKENIDIKYGLLIGLIKVEQIENKDVVDSVLHLLVNGPFDMEQNFMIYSSKCVTRILEVISIVNNHLKAELLSVFIGILRKSKCNLKMTIGTDIIGTSLQMLEQVVSDDSSSDDDSDSAGLVEQLIIDLMGIVAQFNVSVPELRLIIHRLKALHQPEADIWPQHSIELLKVLQQMPARQGPDEFFNFPGTRGSAIAIPPISKWPYQNGWTFNCWIHLDPASATNVERDTPYLYCFRTSKGFGYSGHFVGNNLVITTMKLKDKGLQHCIKYNFQPRKWYMVTVVYVYNRWSKSEIRCYIDGQLTSQVEMSWQVNTNENFDKCYIGMSPEQKPETLLTGQISCIYGFIEALNPHQIAAIYSLGPSYKGNFKYEAESPHHMPDSHRKAAFEGRLSQSLMFSYNPIACDRQLCLNQAPKNLVAVFAHSSHGLMMADVEPVLTKSIYSALHSLGGIKILYPLFEQIDCLYQYRNGSLSTEPVAGIGARLLELLLELLCGSPSVRQQLVQSRGLLLVSDYLAQSRYLRLQLSPQLLGSVVRVCKALSGLHLEHLTIRRQLSTGQSNQLADQLMASIGGSGPRFQSAPVGSNVTINSNSTVIGGQSPSQTLASSASQSVYYHYFSSSHSLELIKHLYDYLLSNTAIWINADPEVQVKLYQYLSEEFLTEGVIFNKTRCINAVLQCLYALKYYYWLVDPQDRSGIISKVPPNAPELTLVQKTSIRTSMLLFTKKLIIKCHNGILEEELQGLLNYLTVINEDDNLRQVLYFCVTLMHEQPSSMVPAFDHKLGVRTVFKLLGSPDESIRIMSLKLLGYFLQRSTFKRKQESMGSHNLFSLIGERLLIYQPYLTTTMYNTLYEILTEKMTQNISTSPHPIPEKTHRLENPLLLKVIAHLIRQSYVTKELIQVHKMFLSDLNHLCNNSRDNRRTVLQMSVWQDWLLMLAPLTPKNADQQTMLDAVLSLVKTLLHHAIKQEYGGWRVWIDTLAILHSKVAYNEFCRDMRKLCRQYEQGMTHEILNPSITTSSSIPEEEEDRELQEKILQNHGQQAESSIDLAESVAKSIVDNIVDSACHKNHQQTQRQPPIDPRLNAGAGANVRNTFSPSGPRSGPFRIPDFAWSPLHQKLLHDLLLAIEYDLQIWERINNRAILDFVNGSENQIYVVNLIHLVTMLSDNLITCCGGLLPLLAAATSPSGDVDLLENGQGMKMNKSISFLLRIMNIADIVVFASNISFTELEQEKTMSSGGILRQCLRLVCTCAVRNCLENRYRELHCQLFNDILQEENFDDDSQNQVSNQLPLDPLQELIRGLRPKSCDGRLDDLLLQNYPISDPQVLLQEMDINRLRAVIYRDVEENKQAQFLALAIVYFLSVLMVSRYRDLLEPPPYDSYSMASSDQAKNDEEEHVGSTDQEVNMDDENDEEQNEDDLYASGRINIETDGRQSRISGKVETESSDYETNHEDEHDNYKETDEIDELVADKANNQSSSAQIGISAIEINTKSENDSTSNFADQRQSKLPDFPQQKTSKKSPTTIEEDNEEDENDDYDAEADDYANKGNRNTSVNSVGGNIDTRNLTKRLELALGAAAPLIREIFFDFSGYLSKTLVGSHGQELVSSGLISLKQSTSVVEMVMLLCSQEWQNSLQKHAGLAFIELVNEGRLLAHASRDHIVRVANEAHFIVSRVRAEDVQRHGEFARLSAVTRQERQTEDRLSEQMINAARARDTDLAGKLKERARQLVYGRGLGVWADTKQETLTDEQENTVIRDQEANRSETFYRLDTWEDDSRRKRRLVPNPYGSRHVEAELKSHSVNLQETITTKTPSQDQEHLKQQMKLLNKTLLSDPGEGLTNTSTTGGYGVTDEELMIDNSNLQSHRSSSAVAANEKLARTGSSLEESHVEPYDLDIMLDHDISEHNSASIDTSVNSTVQNSNGGPSTTSTTVAVSASSATAEFNSKKISDSTKSKESSLTGSSATLTTTVNSSDANHKSSATGPGKSNSLTTQIKPLAVEINGPVVMSSTAILLAPGVNVHGLLSVTKTEFCFEMDSQHKDNIGLDKKVLCYLQHLHGKWSFSEIRAIFSRKFLHRNVAVEIFVANRTAVMFALPDQATVRQLVYCLPRVGIGIKYGVPQHRKSSLASPSQLFRLSSMTRRWQQREISNFDYLIYLNTVAGRTYNDLNQYHIFPWVLSNYDDDGDQNTSTIDLTSPANYRDLSLPIGAMNPTRRHFFQERYQNWDDDSQPPFHFGTHYSTAAFVLNYLIRLEPFTTLFLNLQSGKFDHADRIFHSIPQTWRNCQRDTSDVKELIPEFYYLPEMFINHNNYQFGVNDEGQPVNHVKLPSWARTHEEFIRINRQALESEFVSCQLHHWIDLIFGYKQRGPEAVRATNVFCYLTYEGSVNWSQIKDDQMLRQALEDQIRSFGQTPSQLLTEPHPPRNSAMHVSPLMFTPVQNDLLMLLKFLSNSPVIWLAANVHPASPLPAVITVSGSYQYGLHKWNAAAADQCRRPVPANQSSFTNASFQLASASNQEYPMTPQSASSSSQQQRQQQMVNTKARQHSPVISSSSATIATSNTGNSSTNNTISQNSFNSANSIGANFVSSSVQLPLTADPILNNPAQAQRRSINEGFDLSIRPHNLQFISTLDNKILFAGGFWDNSFRIYSTEFGRLLQVVYGHFGVVTCIARSECMFNQDCYVVTGSKDCTVMLWLWGNKQQALLGDFNCRETAQPRMTITGHQTEIICVQISGELGLVVSSSKSRYCLIHSLHGELLHTIQQNNITRLLISRESFIVLVCGKSNQETAQLHTYTINGRFLAQCSTNDQQNCSGTTEPPGSITSIVLSKGSEYIVVGMDNGCCVVRRSFDLSLVHEFPRCDAAICCVALTSDHRFVLAGLSNGCLVVFNIDFYKWHHEYRDRYPAL